MEEAIAALFEKNGIGEIDFLPEGEWQCNCFVILSTDGAESTREVLIHKCKYEDGKVYVLPFGEDLWVPCEHAGKVVTDTLDDLYDAVYDYVCDLLHIYYVCELDEKGNPTGKVTKEAWRQEYAENMIESRGYIYNDFETALLADQYGSKEKN